MFKSKILTTIFYKGEKYNLVYYDNLIENKDIEPKILLTRIK